MGWAKYDEDIREQIDENHYYKNSADVYPAYTCQVKVMVSIPAPISVPEKKAQKKSNKVTTFICKDCGRPFTLTASNIDFYEKKGLHLPKRCEPCRAFRNACSTKITTAFFHRV